jgi:hypothetical protein
MPNLVERFSRMFRVRTSSDLAVMVGRDDSALPPPNRTTDKPAQGPRTYQMFDFVENRNRTQGYRRYRLIDHSIPEMSRALTIIATNVTAGDRNEEPGFRLDYAQGFLKRDRMTIEDLLYRRLDMRDRVYKMVREKNRMGDVFYEGIVDDRGLIVRLKFLWPERTFRVHDEYDRLVGFKYKGYAASDQELKWWQVYHVMHDPEEGMHYGRSLFAGGGWETAQRLNAIRQAIMFELLNRASARHAITWPFPIRMSPEEVDDRIDDLKEELTREPIIEDQDGDATLYRQAVAQLNQQDLVIPYAVDLEGRSSEPHVYPLKSTDVGDMQGVAEHFQDLAVLVTGVPKAFLGIERQGDSSSSTRLDKQDLQFARQLRRDQQDAANFILEVVRRQFIFLRRGLRDGDVVAKMPDLREVDRKLRAEITKLLIESVEVAVRSGLPPKYVWYEVVFDGNYDLADQVGEALRIDFEAELVTAEQRAAEANLALRGNPGVSKSVPNGSKNGSNGESKEVAADHLAQQGRLVREIASTRNGISVPIGGVGCQ